ncbi:MAG: hypothetical protein JKY56_16900 [Kofleriaceae bacterium]|nr:hypothetical protein [Kofleriaceae bacterium]
MWTEDLVEDGRRVDVAIAEFQIRVGPDALTEERAKKKALEIQIAAATTPDLNSPTA